MVVESKAYTVLSRSKPRDSLSIHRASGMDEHLGEVSIDAPVVRFIRVGQSRARHLAAKAHVIQLAPSVSMLRCRAGSHDRSVGQMPNKEIDPNR
jgi:hypothetical protein